MASVMYLNFSVQEEYTLEHSDAKCHMCTLFVKL